MIHSNSQLLLLLLLLLGCQQSNTSLRTTVCFLFIIVTSSSSNYKMLLTGFVFFITCYAAVLTGHYIDWFRPSVCPTKAKSMEKPKLV